MLGQTGYFTGLPNEALKGMINIVKGMELEVGYSSIVQLSEVEAYMRQSQIKRRKTVSAYCGVGCWFDISTKERQILKVEPLDGPANGVSTCIKGKFRVGLYQQSRSPDQAADS